MINSALFTGMLAVAGHRIYYKFGDNISASDISGEHVFQVPPLAGSHPPSRSTRMILFDDLGRGSTDDTYTWNEYGRPAIFTMMSIGAQVAAGEIDAIYHGGDISYAVGFEAVWDFFLNMISPIASGCVYLTTVGNHESDWPGSPSYFNGTDSGGECGVSATQLIPMPAPATTNSPWWSYDIGIVHFVGMSTEHNFTRGSIQYQWIENDLKTVNRTLFPWIIFGGHRPMYISSSYNSGPSSDVTVMNLMIQNIEPLLWKYKVNVGFYGHNHAVQRQSAVFNRQVVQASTPIPGPNGTIIHFHSNPQATVHMIVGTGGAAFSVNYLTPPPAWTEAVFYKYGYARVTATNATHLDWQWVDCYTNQVLDHMVITQDSNISAPWVLPLTSPASTTTSPSPAAVLSVGAAVGVALAVVVGVVMLGVGAWWVMSYRGKQSMFEYCHLATSSTSPSHVSSSLLVSSSSSSSSSPSSSLSPSFPPPSSSISSASLTDARFSNTKNNNNNNNMEMSEHLV